MKLPDGHRAIVSEQKLSAYVLSERHEVGGPKARIFRAVFGMGPEHAAELADALRNAASASYGAVERSRDQYGVRYRLDFVLTFNDMKAAVRSGWIVRSPGEAPEFLTAWVLRP